MRRPFFLGIMLIAVCGVMVFARRSPSDNYWLTYSNINDAWEQTLLHRIPAGGGASQQLTTYGNLNFDAACVHLMIERYISWL